MSNALYETETYEPLSYKMVNCQISKAAIQKGRDNVSGKTIKSGALYLNDGKHYSLRGVK